MNQFDGLSKEELIAGIEVLEADNARLRESLGLLGELVERNDNRAWELGRESVQAENAKLLEDRVLPYRTQERMQKLEDENAKLLAYVKEQRYDERVFLAIKADNAALREYARHKNRCAATCLHDPGPCSCGLGDLLKEGSDDTT